MKKANEISRKSMRHLGGIAFLAVCVYFGFGPLFEYVDGGVEGAVVGASFGAIFVIVLTMYLLNKQTELEQDSKRGEKVFEEKVDFYKSLLNTVKEALQDGVLTGQELNQLSFAAVKLQMVGADETIKAFTPVLEKCIQIYQESPAEDDVEIDDDAKITILEHLAEFSQRCRVDLGIDEADVDPEIFKAMFAQISKGVTRKGNKEYFDDLDGKLQQLANEGYNENGIESYRILMSLFNDKAKSADRYSTNMAKSGSSFNDSYSSSKMQIYVRNPQKRSSGVGVEIKEASGLVDAIRQQVLNSIGKDQSDSVRMVTEIKGKPVHDCYLAPSLADELGVTVYHELLGRIGQQVFSACEARGREVE